MYIIIFKLCLFDCSAIVQRVNDDGTLCIAFDDGEILQHATVDKIRSPAFTVVENADTLLDFINANKLAINSTPEKPIEPVANTVGDILHNVEKFLLPADNTSSITLTAMSNPRQKLESALVGVAILEHIRSLQTMYRDDDDELGLSKHLRRDINGAANTKLTTKDLMERISNDRARILAFTRLCFGDKSFEMVRAELDIGASYALRGMWAHVTEKASKVEDMISHLNTASQHQRHDREWKQAVRIAKRVACVFDCLRDHVKEYCGQVTPLFLDVLRQMLLSQENVEDAQSPSRYSSFSNQVTELISSISDFISSCKKRGIAIAEYNSRNQEQYSRARLIKGLPNVGASEEHNRVSASWGEMVGFLRTDCVVMKTWILDMQNTL